MSKTPDEACSFLLSDDSENTKVFSQRCHSNMKRAEHLQSQDCSDLLPQSIVQICTNVDFQSFSKLLQLFEDLFDPVVGITDALASLPSYQLRPFERLIRHNNITVPSLDIVRCLALRYLALQTPLRSPV